MYITQNIANRIKMRIKQQGYTTKQMLSDLNMGINAISEFSKGKHLSCISLAKIADYLECSVDYLLGRTNVPEVNREAKPLSITEQFQKSDGRKVAAYGESASTIK